MSNPQAPKQSDTVLIVDDDEDALYALEGLLTHNGYTVISAFDGQKALELIESEAPDIVLMDVTMPVMDGYEVTRRVKSHPTLRYIPIVLVTSRDDLEDITKGLSLGADDYLGKPYKKEELLARVSAVLRTRRLYQELQRAGNANQVLSGRLAEQLNFSSIIGESPAIRDIYSLIDKVKDADVPVLVTGESGTGKELVAHAIHFQSTRKSAPFVVQNCAALQETLLESELFGHERGSFTGAVRDKQGLFETAHGGSFFLDEIGEMSVALQVKLLRVLQDGTFTPVGSVRQKKVDVRIIAATNRDLKEMVSQGKFREDLYYRLNVMNIKLPPLRERTEDIPLLVNHFLNQIAKRRRIDRKEMTQETMNYLRAYNWPGNIRELQNEIERLVIMSGSEQVIEPEYLSAPLQKTAATADGTSPGQLKEALESLERTMIEQTLKRVGWNKSEAARELGISRSNLIAKVQAFGLEEK